MCRNVDQTLKVHVDTHIAKRAIVHFDSLLPLITLNHCLTLLIKGLRLSRQPESYSPAGEPLAFCGSPVPGMSHIYRMCYLIVCTQWLLTKELVME